MAGLILRRWWQALRAAKRAHLLKRRSIPESLWRLTVTRYAFLARRSSVDLDSLREMTALFLAEKEFFGANGLHVSDEMAVAIAAQACLPILQLGLDWYGGFKGIVVHVDAVVARREFVDDDGVVHEYDEELTGEAMEGGPLMLSWRDVEESGDSAEWGYNVVIHEFAHVIDMRDGVADGVPPLADRAATERWQRVMAKEYQEFCDEVDRGNDTVLDPYGADSPGEFFAVAVEAFFTLPDAMVAEHPDLYRLLAEFFCQDPTTPGSSFA